MRRTNAESSHRLVSRLSGAFLHSHILPEPWMIFVPPLKAVKLSPLMRLLTHTASVQNLNGIAQTYLSSRRHRKRHERWKLHRTHHSSHTLSGVSGCYQTSIELLILALLNSHRHRHGTYRHATTLFEASLAHCKRHYTIVRLLRRHSRSPDYRGRVRDGATRSA